MASEKKMFQIHDTYEANKGKEGVTISKICKQSGVPITEYVDWLTLQAKPKLVPVEIVEHEKTPAPARTEISIKADLVLPNGLNLRHESICLSELRNLIDKIAVLSERSIRPFTVGRSACKGFTSEEGVMIAARFYTLVETCKLNGVSPRYYFVKVLEALTNDYGDYEKLTPDRINEI